MTLAAPTVLVAPPSTANALQTQDYTSAAFTPTAGALVFVCVTVQGSANDTGPVLNTAITATDPGLTGWVLVGQYAPAVRNGAAMVLFAAQAPASPVQGTVNVHLAGQPPEAKMGVYQITGQFDGTDSITGTVVVGGINVTQASLNAVPETSDYVLGFALSRNANDPFIPSAGWSVLAEANNPVPSASQFVQYRTGTTDTLVPFNGINTSYNAVIGLVITGPPALPSAAGFTRVTDVVDVAWDSDRWGAGVQEFRVTAPANYIPVTPGWSVSERPTVDGWQPPTLIGSYPDGQDWVFAFHGSQYGPNRVTLYLLCGSTT